MTSAFVGGHTAFASPLPRNVFAWGSSQYGQLGQGDQMNEPVPQLLSTLADDDVIHISAGADVAAALTNDGRLYTWGRGQFMVLGHGDESTINTPKLVEADTEFKTMDISGTHALAVDTDGKLWSWGSRALGHEGDGYFPQKVCALENHKMKSVASGRNHSLAVSEDGSLFAWGSGQEGALGLGSKTDHETPKLVGALTGKRVTQVSAGHGFSLILTDEGQVFSCGICDFGQLGLGSSTERYTLVPTLIRSLRKKKVVSISAGQYHAGCVTEDGEVYVFGHGQDGQIGTGSRITHNTTPQLVTGVKDATQVSCGGGHTAAVTAGGQLFVWGRGSDGQIGTYTRASQAAKRPEPMRVDFLSDQKKRVRAVALGQNFSMALA